MSKRRSIPWRRLDPQLLEAALLPKNQRSAALAVLANQANTYESALYARLKYIGYRAITPQMGARGAQMWLKDMRETIRLYHNNIRLVSLAVGRYDEIIEQIKQFATQEFSDRDAAKFLQVTPEVISFWAETLGALHRNPKTGSISGAELQRFFQDDRHLLANARLNQRYRDVKTVEVAGPGGSGPQKGAL